MRNWILLGLILFISSLAGTMARTNAETRNFTEMVGVWSNGEGLDYYFDGRSMTLLTRRDPRRGPGTVAMLVEAVNGVDVSGQWLTSAVRFTPVEGKLEGDTLTLSYGRWSWRLKFVSEESLQEIAARFPEANLTDTTLLMGHTENPPTRTD